MDVFGDAEAVLVLVGIVCAAEIGGPHIVFVVRQIVVASVRFSNALQRQSVGLDEVCLVGRDVADDQFGPVDDHLVVEVLERLMEVGERDFGLHAAGCLHKQLVAPDRLLAEKDFLREVCILGCVVVVGNVCVARAVGFAGEGVFGGRAAVVIVEGDAGQGAGHVGDQDVAGVAGMGNGGNAKPFEEGLEAGDVGHLRLVVQQVLSKSLGKSDAQVRAVGAGVHHHGGVGLDGIAGEAVVERSGVVGGGAAAVVAGIAGERFRELVNADAHLGGGVAVIVGDVKRQDYRVEDRRGAEVERRTTEGELGTGGSGTVAEHRVVQLPDHVGRQVRGIDGVLQQGVGLHGAGVGEVGAQQPVRQAPADGGHFIRAGVEKAENDR